MRNIFLLLMICCMFSGCIVKDLANSIGIKPIPESPREPLRDAETGKIIEMWVPKHASVNATWEFQARGEEDRCSRGYYIGKNIMDMLPSEREIYKVLPRYGNKIWAYYYYYGEDMPGVETTWYETVFNIYSDPTGRIYGCYWKKYPFGYVSKYGTLDGIEVP